MKDRIKRIRKEMGLNQTEFGETLGGATQYMITSYETGRVTPDGSVIELICEKYNIRKEWLLTGEGEMYRTGIIPELTQVLRHNPALEAMLGAMLDKMGPEDWDALNRIVEKAMKKEQP